MDRKFKIIIYSIIIVFYVFLVIEIIDKSYQSKYTKVCNDLTFFEPLEDKEAIIQRELKEIYGHDIWVSCSGQYVNEHPNIFWGKDGNNINCRMMCSAYHYTEYYYTPLDFWFNVNYQEYLNYKRGK